MNQMTRADISRIRDKAASAHWEDVRDLATTCLGLMDERDVLRRFIENDSRVRNLDDIDAEARIKELTAERDSYRLAGIELHEHLRTAEARIVRLEGGLRGVLADLDTIWVFSVHDYPEQGIAFHNALATARALNAEVSEPPLHWRKSNCEHCASPALLSERDDLGRGGAPEHKTPRYPAIEGEDQSEYMCENCVTPWKCNGPHIVTERDMEKGGAPE